MVWRYAHGSGNNLIDRAALRDGDYLWCDYRKCRQSPLSGFCSVAGLVLGIYFFSKSMQILATG